MEFHPAGSRWILRQAKDDFVVAEWQGRYLHRLADSCSGPLPGGLIGTIFDEVAVEVARSVDLYGVHIEGHAVDIFSEVYEFPFSASEEFCLRDAEMLFYLSVSVADTDSVQHSESIYSILQEEGLGCIPVT